MARQNIQFKGLRHTPSDITGQDGDLLECVNLIHENGEMKPLEMPERTAHRGFYGNDTLVAVHNLTDGKKFVYAVYNQVNTYIHIKNENGEDNDVLINGVVGRGIPNEEIKWAETIGNTLIIGTDKSIHYALYKNGQYKWLGDKLPQPVFEFDFKRDSVRHDGWSNGANGFYINEYDPKMFTLLHDGNPIPGGGVALSSGFITSSGKYNSISLSNTTNENKKIFRDGVKSRVVQVMSKTKNGNVFVFPFFVRYAARMYDGNYTMHSAPILMIPSSLTNPLLSFISINSFCDGTSQGQSQHDSENTPFTYANEGIRFRPMELIYTFKGFVDSEGNPVQNMDDWSDVIKGADIFLSSQIYSYDETAWDNLDHVPTHFYCFEREVDDGNGGYTPAPNWQEYGHCYTQNQKIDWWDIFVDDSDWQGGTRTPIFDYDDTLIWDTGGGIQYNAYRNLKIPLPQLGERQMMDKIKETHLFYRAKQYDLEELKGFSPTDEIRFSTEVDRGILERLETLPTLPDDYVSRCRMVGSVNYNYNQRLVLGNISLQAPRWYQDAKLFPKTPIYNLRICFEIEKPERTIRVRYDKHIENELGIGVYDFGHYIFYPDPDCKRAYVSVIGSGVSTHFIVPMHEHTGLHGAYALMPDLKSLHEAAADNDFGNSSSISVPDESDDRYYQLPNTIAMSSVANPFHFPATNFKDIGRTKVVGIAANVLDVSSGQWGQYPLYVFCSDGIIAVMIDGEGKMGGIQAVSADVLREPHGLSQPTLIQTNQMLVFITQRGVMAIAGTRINCISEAMNGRHFNAMQELDGVDYHVGAFENLITRASEDTSFQLFADSGFLGYDYAHNRVLLLRPDREYQYVLSLNTMLWSKEIIYTNLPSFQLDLVPTNTLPEQRSNALLDVVPIHAVVNNYTELYLQDTDSYLYKTMDVQGENSVKQIYQYGYLVSRPIRFGTDEYKTLVRTLHRYTHFANMSFVKMAVYGSRDGVKYGRINTLRGMSYQYFIFVVYTYLKPNERYSYLTVDFETRLTNKLR